MLNTQERREEQLPLTITTGNRDDIRIQTKQNGPSLSQGQLIISSYCDVFFLSLTPVSRVCYRFLAPSNLYVHVSNNLAAF